MPLSVSAPSTSPDASLAAQFFASGPTSPADTAQFDTMLSDAAAPDATPTDVESETIESDEQPATKPAATPALIKFPHWLIAGTDGSAPLPTADAAELDGTADSSAGILPALAVEGEDQPARAECPCYGQTETTAGSAVIATVATAGQAASASGAIASSSNAAAKPAGKNPRTSSANTRTATAGKGTASSAATIGASPASSELTPTAGAVDAMVASPASVSTELLASNPALVAGPGQGSAPAADASAEAFSGAQSPRRMNFTASAGQNTPAAQIAAFASASRGSTESSAALTAAVTAELPTPTLPASNFASNLLSGATAPATFEGTSTELTASLAALPLTPTAAKLAPEFAAPVATPTTEISLPTGASLPSALVEASSADLPEIRFDGAVPSREEIFAAIDGRNFSAQKTGGTASDKTFLSASPKRVVTRGTTLGTDVANSEAVMPNAPFSNRPSFVAPLERTFDAPVATTSSASASTPSTEPTAVAHRAVDAVLTAVERFTAGDRHSVQMQFSVGGTDLSVRVELRGAEVRTTFRTDSPELRNALAHEWQAATADSADRSVRIAPPVFSSNNNQGFSAFSGDTASQQQRDARARQGEAGDLFSTVAARSRSTNAFGSSVGEVAAATARAFAPATSLHLSTLA
jgi:hypothetical protein